MKRLPSEYFATHVRATTEPFEVESPDDLLFPALAALGFEDVLMFASDYPHWDADNILHVRGRLPRTWREKVLWRNAAELYSLDVRVHA